MKIQVLNPIYSKVSDPEDIKEISKVLFLKGSVWKDSQFGKREIKTEKVLVNKGIFLTGFIPKIIDHCIRINKPWELINSYVIDVNHLPFQNIKLPSHINKLTLEQEEAINTMLSTNRGVIHYPTGSGKTVIFIGFLSLFPTVNSLIIVNTQDLLFQTFDVANEVFPGEVGVIGNGKVEPNKITIATIQTLKDLNLEEFGKQIGIVIVDEAHHTSSFSKPFVRYTKDEGSYAKVLSQILAPIRFGFTGSLPYIPEAKMALEGYIGPVIIAKKAIDIDRLAKIKVRLKKLPITNSITDVKMKYHNVYQMGVVYNSRRTRTVIEDAKKLVEEKRTVLIFVTLVEHGKNILAFAKRWYPELKIIFVWAGIAGKDRNDIKKAFNEGKYEIVIADAVWKEGVDIPTLGAMINAAGGKSEIVTIQNAGRGLRKVPGVKEDVILIDYFDPSNRFLRDHFSERLTLYFSMGWLGEE